MWHFTPAIAAGTGFNADLALIYSPEAVPGDPNFTETAMKVISLNPTTGELRTYDTTVNLATHTATARIDSLASYYTIGVVGPFPQRVFTFPLLRGSSGLTARVIINAGNKAAPLALTALNTSGQVISGDGVSNL